MINFNTFKFGDSRLVKKHANEFVSTGAPGSGSTGGFWVLNNGTRTQVISQAGKILESAGIELSDGDSFLDNNGNEVVEFGVVASAVNQVGITNAATGNNPIISAEGEANTGLIFQNSEAEEMLILDSVASSVNELTIRSAATGNNPIIASTGEADTGLEFHNDQGEEGLILDYVASAVNEVTIKNAATGNKPILAATGEADNGLEFHNDQAEEMLILNAVASAVNEVTISNAATGNKPILSATGEADNGLEFHNDQAEEMLILNAVASAVNELTIENAATGANPVIRATGEEDTGITLQNNGSEEIVIFDSIATSVNEFTISSAATGNGPQLAATGDDADVNVEVIPKGVGYVNIQNGGLQVVAQAVIPNNDNGTASTIEDGAIHVDVGAVTNDANDWITLPSLANVPVGHTIKIACNAGTNFELRTPTTSNEKINAVDCDGTQEYLCTDTEMITITKVSDTDGWVATAQTALGAIATAVIPD